jgi:hypothetical protein
LTVWFAAVAVFVQGPHGHREGGNGSLPNAVYARDFARPHALNITGTDASLVVSDGYQYDYCRDAGYCLACLFLKNCKERAVAWRSPVPVMPADDHALYRNPPRCTSATVVSSSPRAPPLSLV